ncbi:MAG TPA: nucleoside hydrolase, partial [Humisphaera sp.]
AEILATVTSVRSPWSAACVDAVNTYYGRPDLPIGVAANGVENPSKYARRVAEACPHDTKVDGPLPDAVDAYRKVLEAQPDGEVVLVTVGYLTNVARLLDVPAEGNRPSGRDLAARKVKRWVCMGGNFIGSPAKDDLKLGNVNFQRDAKSAMKAINEWPGPITFVGREVASVPSGVKVGARLRELPMTHPVRLAYRHYFDGTEKDRHVADLATVLFAVRGYGDLWDPGPAGRISFQPDVTFDWKADPNGPQTYLLKKRDAAGKPNDRDVERALEALLLQPPKAIPAAK